MSSSLHFPGFRRSTALRFAIVGVLIVAASAFPSFSAFGQSAPTCTTNGECPPTQLCCPEFAYPGSPKICKDPVHGHCPLIP
jgi:hypothetical protein